jgi:restriction endonuclease Mrr
LGVERTQTYISNNDEQAKQNIMKAIIRKYSGKGAKELIDVLEQRAAELDSVMGSVKGLVTYTLVRSGDGGFSVTVCQDQAGLDESSQKAKDWIAKNAANTGVAAPEVIVGSVIKHL